MKNVLTSALAVFACAAVVSAQSQTPAQSSTQRPDPAAGRITLQGCVQKNTAAPSATPGATGTAGTASTYVLANAARITAPASPPVPANQPRPDTGSPNMAASSYRLDVDDAKIAAHVGHKVEVTGTIEDQSSMNRTPGANPNANPNPNTNPNPNANPQTGAAAGANSNASASMSGGPMLKVDSVKMIAASCTSN